MVDDLTAEPGDECAPLPRSLQGKSESRKSWARDALGIAKSGGDKLVWPEFDNEADKDLKW